MNTMKRSFILLLLVFLVSCGESTDADALLDQNYISVGNLPALSLGEEKFLFLGTMPDGGNSRKNFRFKVKRPQGEESFSFFFYANRDLSGGLVLTLHFKEGQTWMKFALNGIDHDIPLNSQSDILDISVDVHNDHEDMHILAWKGTGPFLDHEGCVDENECLYNTEEFTFVSGGPWGSQGRASGVYWGFKGDQTVILELEGPNEYISSV